MTEQVNEATGEIEMTELVSTPYELVKPPAEFTGWQMITLMDPLNPDRISTKPNSKLSYLEAWDIKAMLNRIFGFANWSADVIDSEVVYIDHGWKNSQGKPGHSVAAKATMRLTIHMTGATYTEVAAASQAGSQGLGEVMDFALKTAESDALKRCAINLGTQFGLSLYNKGATMDVVQVVMEDSQAIVLRAAREARQAARNAPAGNQPAQQQNAPQTPTQAPPGMASGGISQVAGAFAQNRGQE